MNGLVAGVVIANPNLHEEVVVYLREMLVRVPIDETQFGDLEKLLDRIDLVRPDVLVVEIGGLEDRLEETLRALKSCSSNPALIVVDTVAQPAAIIAAMRAGVIEYLCPPFDGRLRAALQRVFVSRGGSKSAAEAHEGKTLGFLSAKGGCGATTIACHLAHEFQRQTDQRPAKDPELTMTGGLAATGGQPRNGRRGDRDTGDEDAKQCDEVARRRAPSTGLQRPQRSHDCQQFTAGEVTCDACLRATRPSVDRRLLAHGYG